MPSLASLTLSLCFILAVAAGLSYSVGWACDPFGACTNSQMLGCAAGIMFIVYFVVQRLESDPPPPQSGKNEPPVSQH
jgi:hypothetical protein